MKFKGKGIAICATFAIPMCFFFACGKNKRDRFPPGISSDEVVERAARAWIHKPKGELTGDDLRRVTGLDLSGTPITDLTPLARMTEIQRLSLADCDGVRDISPLKNLQKLRRLSLDGCLMSDIGALANLKELTWLSMDQCHEIADLRPLAGLKQMKMLSVEDCPLVSDLGPLSGLTELDEIWLDGSLSVKDLSPLEPLDTLEYLNLTGCRQIQSIPPWLVERERKTGLRVNGP